MPGNGLPDLLVDRSLGRLKVPDFLRSVWPVVRTLDEVYGYRPVEDVEWMSDADAAGWIVVCKDDRIRRHPAERNLLAISSLRVFCLMSGNLKGDQQVARFAGVIGAMITQAPIPGPWMYGVYSKRIEALRIYPASPS
jgi:hypothetical protein